MKILYIVPTGVGAQLRYQSIIRQHLSPFMEGHIALMARPARIFISDMDNRGQSVYDELVNG